MMQRNEAITLRANLLQVMKGLDLMRLGLSSMIADLEKTHNIQSEKGKRNGQTVTSSIENEGGENSPEVSKSDLQNR